MLQPFCHFLTLLCEDAAYAEVISWDERASYKFTIRNRVVLARLWAKFHGSSANSKEIKKMLRDHVTRRNLVVVYSQPDKRCYGYQAVSLKWIQAMSDQMHNQKIKFPVDSTDPSPPPRKRKAAGVDGIAKKLRTKQVDLSMVKVESPFHPLPPPSDAIMVFPYYPPAWRQ
uniref:ETS domain-containing protein n=1 Tax=Panagrellus redivivus TaxID=6233 RepID=A0A7E4WE70_PANRE